MACRQRGKLHAPADEEWVGADEKRVRPLVRKRCECRFDLLDRANLKGLDLQPDGAPGGLRLSHVVLGIVQVSRIDEHGDTSNRGHQLAQKFQPLWHQFTEEKIDPCEVAARPGEAGDKTKLNGVFRDQEDDWNGRGCGLGCDRRSMPPLATMTATCRRTKSAARAGSRSS